MRPKRLSWREKARPIIAQVLQAMAGRPWKEVRAALIEAYPFGTRSHYPYKAWLLEIRWQRGQHRGPRKKGEKLPVPSSPGQRSFL
jgi:hypothetical protein